MGYWNSRGLRGSTFEELINMTNAAYREKGLAMIQKVPTPITPVRLDNENHTISLAYFGEKSTVDYIGVVQGIPVCFDAKETARKSLPLQNVHEHQILFMRDFEKQKGLAFLIVHFRLMDEVYYLPFKELERHWRIAANGGRKSIAYDRFDRELIVGRKGSFFVHYLEALKLVLERDVN